MLSQTQMQSLSGMCVVQHLCIEEYLCHLTFGELG